MPGVPGLLEEHLQHSSPPGSVLIPGCGAGYEVRAFRDHGWKVRAIDFSRAAVERAKTVLGAHADAVRHGDFFGHKLGGPYDLIYERTFLCSLPPDRWRDYAKRVAALLKPGGRLAGMFAYGEEPEPPPFLLSRAAANDLFHELFVLAEDCAIPEEQSLPLFAGKERWQVWRRR